MKNVILRAAVLSTLGLSLQVHAGSFGLVALPATGFAVTGGTTPYTICNTVGNFGSSDTDADSTPTSTVNNACAVNPGASGTSPVSGYSLANSQSKELDYGAISIGTLKTYLWHNTTTNMCIIGARVSTLNSNAISGTLTFEINGIALAGYAAHNGSSSVNAGYYQTSSAGDNVVYRIGRTHTSVQHRADLSNDAIDAPGYVDLPLTSPAPAASTSINGSATPDTSPLAVPTATQQGAALSPNWVEFTTDANFADADGSSSTGTPEVYVEASCPSATYTSAPVAGAVMIRQTGQEVGTFIEIPASGFVPGTDSNVTLY